MRGLIKFNENFGDKKLEIDTVNEKEIKFCW